MTRIPKREIRGEQSDGIEVRISLMRVQLELNAALIKLFWKNLDTPEARTGYYGWAGFKKESPLDESIINPTNFASKMRA